jgi:hypothetical protein
LKKEEKEKEKEKEENKETKRMGRMKMTMKPGKKNFLWKENKEEKRK